MTNLTKSQRLLLLTSVSLFIFPGPASADDKMESTNNMTDRRGHHAQMAIYRACIESTIDRFRDRGQEANAKTECKSKAEALINDLPSNVQMSLLRTEEDVVNFEKKKRLEDATETNTFRNFTNLEADYPRGEETLRRHSSKLFRCVHKEKLQADKHKRSMNTNHCPKEVGLTLQEVDAVFAFAAANSKRSR